MIRGGRIIDGSGNPWFLGDIGVRDGRIARIGRQLSGSAGRAVDATGKVVAPGFIDVHTHIEGDIEKRPGAENFVRMGVTTVVTGNCGGSALPLGPWLDRLERDPSAINVASLVGHNIVRRAGMSGDFDRPPTDDELARMRALVADAMRDGAVGFSSGLEYVPGMYAKTTELAALARESASQGGLYVTHMRDEGNEVEAAVREALEVGEQANCPVQISHFKISSRKRWGASEVSVGMVDEARRRGRQVTVDQDVYTAGSTSLEIIFPGWIFDGGRGQMRTRLQDEATRTRIRGEMVAKAAGQGFPDFSFVQIASYAPAPDYNGKRLPEIAVTAGRGATADAQADLAIDMMLAGSAQVVVHKMNDDDLERILRQPFVMIASDAGIPEMGGAANPHPRGFGNNARALARYVRDRQVISLEDAIRKMTSLPAATFGFEDRGLLRTGLAADIVVFDPERIADPATFEAPKQFAVGVDTVLVNGQLVVDAGQVTDWRPGKALRGPGYERPASASR